MRTRVHADGYLDISDRRRVRTPGNHEVKVDPAPDAEALAFLLSHTFPGHRKIARCMTVSDRKQIQFAMWADSVSERMGLVDRIWRRITDPIAPGKLLNRPKLVQVVRYGTSWAYPLYLDGHVTRVLPHGGVPAPVTKKKLGKKQLHFNLKTA